VGDVPHFLGNALFYEKAQELGFQKEKSQSLDWYQCEYDADVATRKGIGTPQKADDAFVLDEVEWTEKKTRVEDLFRKEQTLKLLQFLLLFDLVELYPQVRLQKGCYCSDFYQK